MSIKIITDSASDIPNELAVKHDIEVIPLIVNLDDKEYLDGESIQPEEVYTAIKNGKRPSSTQVPPSDFEDIFDKYAIEGRECLYIAFSSKLSGTCQTGKMVAEKINEKYNKKLIHVYDTLCGAVGQGLVALKAAKLANEKAKLEEIIKTVKFYSSHMEHIFTIDDLNHLHKGGRLSQGEAFLGSLLKIKPILHVKQGEMIPFEKIRGKTKALRRIVEIMEERGTYVKNQIIGISHANDLKTALKLKEMIKEKLGHEKFMINIVGGVLGCHIGLGGVAVFFLNEDPSTELAKT
ncbi:DegV family protein [Proteinivorax hydrogeniformans]|uniref:DegV family protein n=1 Tax=Proteinivorax hydrogeniformans TaxID=1826727 RepID=A0AAU8HRE3_9FIRM